MPLQLPIIVWTSVAALLLLATPGCTRKITDDDVRRMGADDVARLVQSERDRNVLLIDARPLAQHEAGALPGAVSVRLADLTDSRRLPALERYRTLVVYGQDRGSASAMAVAKRLITQGYSDVRFFDGGVDAWTARGFPLDRRRDTHLDQADDAGS